MCEHMWWIFPKLFCCFSSSMLYSFAQDSDSRTKMPPRPQFSQPQWSFLAMEFHRRRGTKNFLPGLLVDFAAKFPTRWRRLTLQWWEEQWLTWRQGQKVHLSWKMIVDFSLSSVIFAMANFEKRKFFWDTLYLIAQSTKFVQTSVSSSLHNLVNWETGDFWDQY